MSIKKKETPSLELKDISEKSIVFFGKNRLLLVFITIGIALAFALIQTRSVLEISRNETKYTEEKLKINYKSIDQETLESFRLADEDGKVEVNANFDPNRSNPFNE